MNLQDQELAGLARDKAGLPVEDDDQGQSILDALNDVKDKVRGRIRFTLGEVINVSGVAMRLSHVNTGRKRVTFTIDDPEIELAECIDADPRWHAAPTTTPRNKTRAERKAARHPEVGRNVSQGRVRVSER